MSAPRSLLVSFLASAAALAALASGCGGSAPAPAPPPPSAPRFLWPARLVADLGLPAAPEKPVLEAARVDAFVALEKRLRGELASADAAGREAAVREAGFRDAAERAEFAGRLRRAFGALQSLRVLQKMEDYGGSATASMCRGEVLDKARKDAAALGLSEPDLLLVHDRSAELIGLVGK